MSGISRRSVRLARWTMRRWRRSWLSQRGSHQLRPGLSRPGWMDFAPNRRGVRKSRLRGNRDTLSPLAAAERPPETGAVLTLAPFSADLRRSSDRSSRPRPGAFSALFRSRRRSGSDAGVSEPRLRATCGGRCYSEGSECGRAIHEVHRPPNHSSPYGRSQRPLRHVFRWTRHWSGTRIRRHPHGGNLMLAGETAHQVRRPFSASSVTGLRPFSGICTTS